MRRLGPVPVALAAGQPCPDLCWRLEAWGRLGVHPEQVLPEGSRMGPPSSRHGLKAPTPWVCWTLVTRCQSARWLAHAGAHPSDTPQSGVTFPGQGASLPSHGDAVTTGHIKGPTAMAFGRVGEPSRQGHGSGLCAAIPRPGQLPLPVHGGAPVAGRMGLLHGRACRTSADWVRSWDHPGPLAAGAEVLLLARCLGPGEAQEIPPPEQVQTSAQQPAAPSPCNLAPLGTLTPVLQAHLAPKFSFPDLPLPPPPRASTTGGQTGPRKGSHPPDSLPPRMLPAPGPHVCTLGLCPWA